MNEKETTKISKFLSLVLRHQPKQIGLVLDEQGWTSVTDLIDKSTNSGVGLSVDILKHIVETNSKKRFAFSEDGLKIRANQGHSIEIELGYQPNTPPPILYHGTSAKSVEAIMQTGIEKRNRHHVHLSPDQATAISVGGRHGKPVVLEIQTGRMHTDGFIFYMSDNGVWLVDEVPAKYLITLLK
jgi:putative RNA 2'-phosphotransferase